MKYLDGKEGLVTISASGLPITLRVGDWVRLVDKRENRLFAYEWELDGKKKESWLRFKVSSLIDNAVVLDSSDFHFILAVQTGLNEPVISTCDGAEYDNERILSVEFPCGSYGFVITPKYLLPE